jgi:molybdenum cofactor cytidylyltransferase
MGQPKLLLKLHGQTVIARLLDALQLPAVAERVVVIRADDAALRSEVQRAGGVVVAPEVAPPDMRTSVEQGLRHLAASCSPAPEDAWLLVPGDHPVLDRQVIAELIQVFVTQQPRFLVPVYQGRRGHPLLARWETVEQVFRLPKNAGLNQLLHDQAATVVEHPTDSPAVVTDLDTPEDYRRLAATAS